MATTSLLRPDAGVKQLRLPLKDQRFVEAELSRRDTRICSAFDPLEQNMRDACYVYEALLYMAAGASPEIAASNPPSMHITAGYAAIIEHIAKTYKVTMSRRAVQRAVKVLEEFGYIKRPIKARDGVIATTYDVETPRTMMEIFRACGYTHFRVLRGRRVQMVRPRIPNALCGACIDDI